MKQIGKFKIIESKKTHFSSDIYDVKDGRKKVAELSIGCRDITGLFFGKKQGKDYEKQRYFKDFEHCLENLEILLMEFEV